MDRVISAFTAALDELNILTTASYLTASGNRTERVERIADDVLSFLINAYSLGIRNASDMLGYDLAVNPDSMEDAIYLVIEGKTFIDRIADHVASDNLSGLRTLVESEYHRVHNAAVQDGGTEYTNNMRLAVSKTWRTVRDEFVRDTHRYLEDQSILLDEEFFTFDGDHAAYPGGFTKAENNVNCRCIVILKPDD